MFATAIDLAGHAQLASLLLHPAPHRPPPRSRRKNLQHAANYQLRSTHNAP